MHSGNFDISTHLYRIDQKFPQPPVGVCTWVAFGTSCVRACRETGPAFSQSAALFQLPCRTKEKRIHGFALAGLSSSLPPCPSPPFPSLSSLASPPATKPTKESGERCRLPQQDPGSSPGYSSILLQCMLEPRLLAKYIGLVLVAVLISVCAITSKSIKLAS